MSDKAKEALLWGWPRVKLSDIKTAEEIPDVHVTGSYQTDNREGSCWLSPEGCPVVVVCARPVCLEGDRA